MAIAVLSARVNLEQSRKQAKDLVKAFRQGDAAALEQIRWNHPRFRALADAAIRQRPFALADAQLVVARLHSFDSWPRLLQHIARLEKQDPRVLRFERAADAIVAGDIATLAEMLRQHPALVHERSTRAHHAPLLHFVAANGVEGYRQVTPPNVVDVARFLLDAGAEVDAVSDAYGGGSTALGLVATSAHPRAAGAQIPLIDLLLTRGAAIDGVTPGQSVILSALANGCPEAAVALAERGARMDSIVAAAGVNRLDVVRTLLPHATSEERERALIIASWYAGRDIVALLLDSGVDAGASDGMTPLHAAAAMGRHDLIALLLARGAPLEKRNAWDGTVLDSVLWFAHRATAEELARRDYPAVIDALVAAGANTDVHPEMEEQIEAVYRRAGRERRSSRIAT